MVIFPLAPDQTIAQMWSNGARGEKISEGSCCNGSWTPQHVSSATCGSLTTVWRTFDTISYTGWMNQNASNSSYAWPSTSVCTEWDRYICRRCVGRARRRLVVVICIVRLTTAGRRAFSCAGPSAWNCLPEYVTIDMLTLDYFKRLLQCFLFARYWRSTWSALEICNDSALYKCTLNNNNNNNNNWIESYSIPSCITAYVPNFVQIGKCTDVQMYVHTLCPKKNMWLHFLK